MAAVGDRRAHRGWSHEALSGCAWAPSRRGERDGRTRSDSRAVKLARGAVLCDVGLDSTRRGDASTPPDDHRRRPAQVFSEFPGRLGVGMCEPNAFTVPPPAVKTSARKESNLQTPGCLRRWLPPGTSSVDPPRKTTLEWLFGWAPRHRFGVSSPLQRRRTGYGMGRGSASGFLRSQVK